ncbi:MAG: ASKHA domain-containing protein [Candidatus Marinimicrobia bacterium]|nr:ASKHA domain-containing protein [Candidatus Neomarinimicrobiota bacterium]
MKKVALTLYTPHKRHTIFVPAGLALHKAIQQGGFSLTTTCGGYGTCGKCRVLYHKNPPPPTPAEQKHLSPEELKKGIRLACQQSVTKDTFIEIFEETTRFGLHILSEGLLPDVPLNPEIPVKASSQSLYGVAIDLGTTTLVVSLYDLKTGQRLKSVSGQNPQESYGVDIITRATAATESKETQNILQKLILQKINEFLYQLTENPETIVHAVLAGNTVMTHLFLGISMDSLLTAPYQAPVTDMQIIKGKSSGLAIHHQGIVTLLPGIGSFIGGDIAADLLICHEILPQNATYLLMDLGTNCELVLSTPQKTIAASAPAGPVMEGAGITHGMQAEPGALVDLLAVDKEHFIPITLENKKIRGICGSGLIHTIHTLWKENIISEDGRFVSGISCVDEKKGVKISEDIYLTPQDIRAFQMAKAAISATWQLLLKAMSLSVKDLDYFVLAGGFGHYVRPLAGIDMGIFPPLSSESFVYLGNGSLAGCELVLKNKTYTPIIQHLAKEAIHHELAGRKDFQEMYIRNMQLTY